MTKRQHGNRESKKPKRPVTPKPPAAPSTAIVDPAVVAPRQKR